MTLNYFTIRQFFLKNCVLLNAWEATRIKLGGYVRLETNVCIVAWNLFFSFSSFLENKKCNVSNIYMFIPKISTLCI